ncbi:MAG: o-succinylbenzoate synthase [Candidatus Scalindua sp. AMX11]|nr:MAG: o-succinylbenzoate synthase [Candidatus Scalindua sp.]NOG85026.1 o-succinylbenzoate synthase [Planctomycetota bacterium]RZV93078.1 MAG: o-succinylbenzoate synthase [Candidatus Scalindua sp. SCAELEC01]TDE66704.1 MAG: o-succinylbenzoate synthase [Candidatus Scalindua sp. AMX11]GJQ58011.1 MAG: o-succinylbenzoate synthase [Candidatus Scalindua sp.]
MKIEKLEIREITLPLVHFFETSFGRTERRRILLTKVFCDGAVGYGECTAGERPLFSHETIDTAWIVIREVLVPMVLNRVWDSPSDLNQWFCPIRGHQMARAAIENACWDLTARAKNIPLHQLLGGTRKTIPCGVSIGIQNSPEQLLDKITTELSAGYRRIKIKIKPGWDYDIVRQVRKRFPDISLSVDANSAYTLADIDLLKRFDDFNLIMIEQPLSYDDIVDHAQLQRVLRTAICLDEPITSVDNARKAIEMKSGRIINLKLGRVGGFSEAIKIHDYALEHKIPVWCGGMLEAGIGRSHNIAMSTLPGFCLPGDVSASQRYFHEDIIDPPVTVDRDGFIDVPQIGGTGYEPKEEYIEKITVRREVFSG